VRDARELRPHLGLLGAGPVQGLCASARPAPPTETFTARPRSRTATRRQGKQRLNLVGRVFGHSGIQAVGLRGDWPSGILASQGERDWRAHGPVTLGGRLAG
jgi:hypothetical protein